MKSKFCTILVLFFFDQLGQSFQDELLSNRLETDIDNYQQFRPILEINPWFYNPITVVAHTSTTTRSPLQPTTTQPTTQTATTQIPSDPTTESLSEEDSPHHRKLYRVNTNKMSKTDEYVSAKLSKEKKSKLLKYLNILKMKPKHGHFAGVIKKKTKGYSTVKDKLKDKDLKEMVVVIRKDGEDVIKKRMWLSSDIKLNFAAAKRRTSSKSKKRDDNSYSILLRKRDKASKAKFVKAIKSAILNRRQSKPKGDNGKLKMVKTINVSQ